MKNVILMNENWKQNVDGTEHRSLIVFGKTNGAERNQSEAYWITYQNQQDYQDTTRDMGYNAPGITDQNYYEIMESKCIFEMFFHSKLSFKKGT